MSTTAAQPSASASVTPSTSLPDFLTVGAIAVVAYALSDFIHEGIGHGGMCLLSAGHPTLLSTVEFQCNAGADRLVAAAGVFANLAAAIISFLLLRTASRATRLRYFLWLLMAVNLMDAGGYFLFSGVANFGDWAEVISGLQPAWAWHVLLIAVGVVLYVAFVLLSASELRPFLGYGRHERLSRARRLTWTPYLCGSIFICISALPNPDGMFLVAASAAAAAFGGTSGFTWMGLWFRGSRFGPTTHQLTSLTRSWLWIIAAGIIAIIFISILGPGIRFH